MSVPCDECKRPVDLLSARITVVEIRSGRLNTRRHFAFCSDVCRLTWWGKGDEADVLPVVDPTDASGFHENDTAITLAAHHVDKRGDEWPRAVVHDATEHETPHSVNAYWCAPVEAPSKKRRRK